MERQRDWVSTCAGLIAVLGIIVSGVFHAYVAVIWAMALPVLGGLGVVVTRSIRLSQR
jgi:hypothetical protein